MNRSEEAAQEILGFMLAMAAAMLLFGAAVGYGVALQEARASEATERAIDAIAQVLAQSITTAATWAEAHAGSHLNLTVPIARMPGATGFIAEAGGAYVYVNASSGESARFPIPATANGLVAGTVSGSPEAALVRWDPGLELIILETS